MKSILGFIREWESTGELSAEIQLKSCPLEHTLLQGESQRRESIQEATVIPEEMLKPWTKVVFAQVVRSCLSLAAY